MNRAIFWTSTGAAVDIRPSRMTVLGSIVCGWEVDACKFRWDHSVMEPLWAGGVPFTSLKRKSQNGCGKLPSWKLLINVSFSEASFLNYTFSKVYLCLKDSKCLQRKLLKFHGKIRQCHQKLSNQVTRCGHSKMLTVAVPWSQDVRAVAMELLPKCRENQSRSLVLALASGLAAGHGGQSPAPGLPLQLRRAVHSSRAMGLSIHLPGFSVC